MVDEDRRGMSQSYKGQRQILLERMSPQGTKIEIAGASESSKGPRQIWHERVL